MKQKPGFEQRHVECLAVVGDQRARVGGCTGDILEEAAFGAISGQQKLPHLERRALEPSATHQECIRAGASGESGRFEIDEQHTRLSNRWLEERQRRPATLTAGCAVGNDGTTVAMTGRIRPIDDDVTLAARFPPFAIECFRRMSLLRVRDCRVHGR